jgi:GNAT superfamily N-acetyltransferase
MKNTMDNTVSALIEIVEREAWLDLAVAAPADYVKSSKVSYARLGTIVGIADLGVPITEFNRIFGLGIEKPVNEEELDQAISWMNAHATPTYALQVSPNALPETKLTEWIKTRGFKNIGSGLAKFYRCSRLVEDHAIPTTLDVRLVETHDAEEFGRVAQAGFGLPLTMIPFLSAIVGRPNWKAYIAYDGDIPVASGAMFIDHNWAWLGIDATLPDYRGRGAQNALIKQRLSDGIAAGVIGFTAETGQPPQGQESTNKSYNNYQRAGFTRAYVRQNYKQL